MAKDKENQAHPDTIAQVEKFRELARELGTDDDEARFDERLKKLARAPKPKDEPKPKG